VRRFNTIAWPVRVPVVAFEPENQNKTLLLVSSLLLRSKPSFLVGILIDVLPSRFFHFQNFLHQRLGMVRLS
jgi:hypothetical protein